MKIARAAGQKANNKILFYSINMKYKSMFEENWNFMDCTEQCIHNFNVNDKKNLELN